jgi:hypothetical protein
MLQAMLAAADKEVRSATIRIMEHGGRIVASTISGEFDRRCELPENRPARGTIAHPDSVIAFADADDRGGRNSLNLTCAIEHRVASAGKALAA